MDARKLALRCRELAAAKKAEHIVILDLRKLSSVTDYFVIATGASEPHLRAIVEDITERLQEECALRPRATDGILGANWVVLDYEDVIVHVMRQETREFYDLESLWGDAPRVRARKASAAKPAAKARRKRPAIQRRS